MGCTVAETLFPQRQRCKTCRSGLGARAGDPVLMGLYCSSKCASMATPATQPTAAPRECKTQRDGSWVFKRRYRSEHEIPDKIRQDPSTNWYWCGHCGHLHVGRTLVELKKADSRGLRERKDLSDLLVKARGKATLKQVGSAAGIRPIRIKEWENPDFDAPSLDALFKLLRVYRIDLAAAFTSPCR